MAKWTEERKRAWSEQCKLTGCNNKKVWTDEARRKQSELSRKINNEYWTPERRAEQSARMKQKVLERPESYSKTNVSGRVKLYEINDSYGKTKVKGTWELKVAEWLNKNNIIWTNNIEPYKYHWNNQWHLYFPDFLLVEKNILIEVKGYQTDRDLAKWESVDRELIILKAKEIMRLDAVLGGLQ